MSHALRADELVELLARQEPKFQEGIAQAAADFICHVRELGGLTVSDLRAPK